MEKPRFSQHDNYRVLEVLSKESDFIQSELYKNSGKTMKRNDGILYYDCTNLKSNSNYNSSNSSNPPSSDQKGVKKANEYNSRKKTDRKPGGQQGHKGKTLTKSDVEELIASGKCNHTICEHGDKHTDRYAVKYEMDINFTVTVIEHRIYDSFDVSKMPDSEELRKFYDEYDEIIAKGRKENKNTRPKWAKKEENALLNRLEKYKENHLLFLKNFDVAFSNNMSECDLRKCKNRRKLIGGFRTNDGLTMFADLMSVVETARRQGESAFETLIGIADTAVI